MHNIILDTVDVFVRGSVIDTFVNVITDVLAGEPKLEIVTVDTVFGHVSGKISEAGIGRWKSGDWLTRKLPMAYNTDDKATGYN